MTTETLIIATMALAALSTFLGERDDYNDYNYRHHHRQPTIIVPHEPHFDPYAYERWHNRRAGAATVWFVLILIFLLFFFSRFSKTDNNTQTQQPTTYSNKF